MLTRIFMLYITTSILTYLILEACTTLTTFIQITTLSSTTGNPKSNPLELCHLGHIYWGLREREREMKRDWGVKRSRTGRRQENLFSLLICRHEEMSTPGGFRCSWLGSPADLACRGCGNGPSTAKQKKSLSFGLSLKPGWVCSACTKYVFSWDLQSASLTNGEAASSLLLSLLNPWQGEDSWVWVDLEKIIPVLAWLTVNTAIVLARNLSGSVDLLSPGRGSSQAHCQHPSRLSQEKKHEHHNWPCTSSTQNSFRHLIDIY